MSRRSVISPRSRAWPRYRAGRVFVKICGITCEEDALLAVAMGADALGFVFAPSTRQVSASTVYDITRRLPPEVLTVGVFRDEHPARVVETVRRAGLRAAQLHGHEHPGSTRDVRGQVPFVIKAFVAGSPALDLAEEHGADAILLDSAEPGSGQVFDWRLADGVPNDARVMLAGGLTADNVADAVRRLRPWGVDVSSGVEREAGRKDAVKVKDFIEAARGAAPVEDDVVDDSLYDWKDE
jgi:phosphoribosylanthranilate isomerase